LVLLPKEYVAASFSLAYRQVQRQLSDWAESGHSLRPSVPSLCSLRCQPAEVEQQYIIPGFSCFFMFFCKAFGSQLNSFGNPNGKIVESFRIS